MAKLSGSEAVALVQYQYEGRDVYNDAPYTPAYTKLEFKYRGKYHTIKTIRKEVR